MLPDGMTSDLVRTMLDIFGERLLSVVLYGSVARGELSTETETAPQTPLAPIDSTLSKWDEEEVDLAVALGLVPDNLKSKFTTKNGNAGRRTYGAYMGRY